MAQIFNPQNHPTVAPTYSHISQIRISPTSTLISFAGQVGQDSATGDIPATLGEQCSLAFANVDKCLEAVHATKKDIIQVRHYVVNLLRGGQGPDPERAQRYSQWMEGNKPPSTLLGVDALFSAAALYEIEVVCVVNDP